MFSRIIMSALVFLFLSYPAEAGQRLSSAEISALAPGNYIGTWKGKRQLALKFSPNGTIAGTIDGKQHSGRWYVSGGNLCLVFRVLVVQKTKCGTIHRSGSWYIGYYKKGKPRLRIRAIDSSRV